MSAPLAKLPHLLALIASAAGVSAVAARPIESTPAANPGASAPKAAAPGAPATPSAPAQPVDDTAATAAAVQASNRFTLELFRTMQSEKENVFASPWSVATALDMARAGAAGKTHDEMTRALHLAAANGTQGSLGSLSSLDNAMTGVRKSVSTLPPDAEKMGYRLEQANRLWAHLGEPIVDGYAKDLAARFNADAVRCDFGNNDALTKEVNAWAAEKTHDMIKTVVAPGDLPPSGFTLSNAVYFQGCWANAFDVKRTKNEAFTAGSGAAADVPMMHQVHEELAGTFKTDKAGEVKAVELAYQGPARMLLLLPEAGKMDQLVASLDIDAARKSLRTHAVDLAMPRLKVESRYKLRSNLMSLGMSSAFSPGADFTRLTPTKPCFIGEVIHVAALNVDEKKTEASAVTVLTMPRGMPPRAPEPFTMTLNRPFLLAIIHEPTGAVLFIGRINEVK